MLYTKECDVPTKEFDVSNFFVHVHEGTPSDPPTTIIHEGQDAWICFHWTQTGDLPFEGWFAPNCHYDARVFLEQMGPGEAPNVSNNPMILVKQGLKTVNYHQDIRLPKLKEGVYRVVVTLNFYSPGHKGTIFHSFAELGMIEVVRP